MPAGGSSIRDTLPFPITTEAYVPKNSFYISPNKNLFGLLVEMRSNSPPNISVNDL